MFRLAKGVSEDFPAGIPKLVANREECRLGTGKDAERFFVTSKRMSTRNLSTSLPSMSVQPEPDRWDMIFHTKPGSHIADVLRQMCRMRILIQPLRFPCAGRQESIRHVETARSDRSVARHANARLPWRKGCARAKSARATTPIARQ